LPSDMMVSIVNRIEIMHSSNNPDTFQTNG